jgi:hypothetical protein
LLQAREARELTSLCPFVMRARPSGRQIQAKAHYSSSCEPAVCLTSMIGSNASCVKAIMVMYPYLTVPLRAQHSLDWLTGWMDGLPLTSVAHWKQHCRVQTSAEPRPGRGKWRADRSCVCVCVLGADAPSLGPHPIPRAIMLCTTPPDSSRWLIGLPYASTYADELSIVRPGQASSW